MLNKKVGVNQFGLKVKPNAKRKEKKET